MNKPALVFLKLRIILFITMLMVLSSASVQAALSELEVSQLYVSIFNRASEGEGNQYWRALKLDMATTADVMLETDAAKQYFGTSLNSNQAFIEHIYRNTLNKTLSDDADGIAYWTGLLDGGMPRGQVVSSMVSVINDYAPGGKFYNPDDAVTVAAYNQFLHRVIISSYMAYNVQNTPADWATSTSFSVGLIVTDASETILSAMNKIDAIAAGNEENTAIAIPASIDLPAGAPIAESSIEVEVFDQAFSGDDLTNLPIKVSRETPTDASIMLPTRSGDAYPTVYLFSTVFPGDSAVTLDAETTAISLVMNSIPRYVLEHAAAPQTVRQTVRVNADAFIQQFIALIEADPYCLRNDNLENVYDATYVEGVVDSYSALKSLLSDSPRMTSWSTGAVGEVTESLGGQFVVTPVEEQEGFRIVAEFKNGHMTGNLFVQNDTRLYAHFQVVTTTNDVIKEIPRGLVNTAYSPEILGSQSSFWGGFLSTEQKVETGFRNVKIDIETPGLLEQGPGYYDSSAPGLMARSSFANFILPIAEIVLPVSDAGKAIFAVLGDSGVFDDAVMQAWQSGDIRTGVDAILGNLTQPVLSKMIEKSFEYSLEKGRLATLIAKLTLRLSTVNIMGSITAIDLGAYEYDLKNTHASLHFNVMFPITLYYRTHFSIHEEGEQPPEISVHGNGLGVFTYEDTVYSPTVVLTALDREREFVDRRVLRVPDITANEEGTRLGFYLPRAWLGQDDSLIKNVDVVDVKIQHHFIQPGTFFNSLEFVELPSSELEQDDYRVKLTSGLMITSLSKSQVQGLDVLEITGSGFAEEAATNEVYLVIDRSGYKNPVNVDYVNLDRTLLKVTIPSHEALMLVGKASIHVESADGTVSNTLPIDIIPEEVTALPGSTAFDAPLTVTLSSPQAYTYILYSTDGGTTEQVYTDELLIDQSTTVFARARTEVEGVVYDSKEVFFTYSQCADGQMIENGECVAEKHCDHSFIGNSVNINEYTLHFDATYKMCKEVISDPDSMTGETIMLYFYKSDGSGTYTQPILGSDRYNFARASYAWTIPNMDVSVSPLPDFNNSTVKYVDPESSFGFQVVNYDTDSENNAGDYLWLKKQELENGTWFNTIINTEWLEADGSYTGNY